MQQKMERTIQTAITAAVVSLLLVGWSGCNKMQETKTIPTVEVWLLEPVERMQGHSWTRYDDGRPLETIAIEKPCSLIIHLPSGKQWRTWAKAITFVQDKGIITSVAPLPLNDLVEYQQAVDETKRIVETVTESEEKKLRFLEKLNNWEAQKPVPSSFMNFANLIKIEEKASVFIEIKASPDSNGKWFVAIDFTTY